MGHNKWRNPCLDCSRISNEQHTIAFFQTEKMVKLVSLNKYVSIYKKLCCNIDRTIFHFVLSS